MKDSDRLKIRFKHERQLSLTKSYAALNTRAKKHTQVLQQIISQVPLLLRSTVEIAPPVLDFVHTPVGGEAAADGSTAHHNVHLFLGGVGVGGASIVV